MQIDMTKRKTYTGDVFDALLGRGWAIQEAVDFCDRLPTIDAVEVVRCKDCKNWYNACCGLGTGNCSALERLTFETFSCAYGERR